MPTTASYELGCVGRHLIIIHHLEVVGSHNLSDHTSDHLRVHVLLIFGGVRGLQLLGSSSEFATNWGIQGLYIYYTLMGFVGERDGSWVLDGFSAWGTLELLLSWFILVLVPFLIFIHHWFINNHIPPLCWLRLSTIALFDDPYLLLWIEYQMWRPFELATKLLLLLRPDLLIRLSPLAPRAHTRMRVRRHQLSPRRRPLTLLITHHLCYLLFSESAYSTTRSVMIVLIVILLMLLLLLLELKELHPVLSDGWKVDYFETFGLRESGSAWTNIIDVHLICCMSILLLLFTEHGMLGTLSGAVWDYQVDLLIFEVDYGGAKGWRGVETR